MQGLTYGIFFTWFQIQISIKTNPHVDNISNCLSRLHNFIKTILIIINQDVTFQP